MTEENRVSELMNHLDLAHYSHKIKHSWKILLYLWMMLVFLRW